MLTKREAGQYLAGFIDGEGTVSYWPETGTREIWIYNNDPDLIDAVVECCDILEIACTTRDSKTRPGSLYVRISQRKNLELIAQHCPLRSKKKRETLLEALSSYKQSGYMKRVVSNTKEHRHG